MSIVQAIDTASTWICIKRVGTSATWKGEYLESGTGRLVRLSTPLGGLGPGTLEWAPQELFPDPARTRSISHSV
ncbi:uncharacterized protein N7459_009833 [Penicillium hispanicum]|uniref:uncharacterized protein n=1 Tax=Penicillium hispanicum TaxID=1080232 RepID=UPI0025406706|nr:uncharacterized protein N7459_009833 [Penicillium hispanicum]KAJ5570403.1 hypothetical protein N7459_009833 [Penicillium hispanicum]